MPRGKKELAEQIIPYAASVEVEVGRGKTVANGGQEDRCDGAEVLAPWATGPRRLQAWQR